MNFIKLKLIIVVLVVLSGVFIHSVVSQTPNQKFKKIQKYIDDATNDNLVGVVIYIKSAKYGNWIGTSGFSNFKEKISIKKDDIFSLASIGKTYTAVTIMKLVEEGKIELDDKIEKYLPKEIINGIPNSRQVTIRHLLGHTSGFYNYNRNPMLNELYLDGKLKLDTLSHINALRRYAYGSYPQTESVGTFSYSSTNYLLLTMIMDSVLPKGHEDYLRKAILSDNKFEKTYYKQTPVNNRLNYYGDIDKDGLIDNLSAQTLETTNWYSGDDGIYAPIEEAVDFFEKLLKGKILKETSLKEMTTWNDEKNPDYGLGLSADKGFPYKFLIGHSGRGIGVTTDLYHFPKQDMTIAIFCNTGLRSGSKEIGKTYYKMRNKIMKKMFLF